MKLSVIIPAFNEAKRIEPCLRSLFQALDTQPGLVPEVIVADNNSTDATAELAGKAGARVVFEPVNQIGRARNAGAALATGDWLLFIDADSWLHPGTLAEMLEAIRSGKVAGGGCLVALDHAPWWALLALQGWNILSRCRRWAAGSFLFCRTDAFRQTGGFSPELFAAEEIDLSQKLKRWAKARGLRFTILTAQPHTSSGRKFHLYSKKELSRYFLRCLLFTRSAVRSRDAQYYFYEGRR